MALELCQPGGAFACGFVYFCETAAFRKIGGFNNELFAAEELGVERAAEAAGAGDGPENRNFARSSADDFRAEIAALHHRGSPQIADLRALFNRRALTRRESCTLWYDGPPVKIL